MALGVPRNEGEVPAWREGVTEILNDLPEHIEARVVTTTNAATLLKSVPIPSGAVFYFDWEVVARQSAGSSGTVGDGLVYAGKIAFHLVGSTATVIGSGTTQLAVKDDSGWAVAVAGDTNQAKWTVTGNTDKTIGWRLNVNVRRIFF